MNLHLLRLFCAVAEDRSFSRAAETLHISQPAVSKGIRTLESQLGTPLFERKSGDLQLSEAGALLLGHAQALFATERLAEEELGNLRGLQRGTLRIGASTTVAAYFLPAILASFRNKYPGVDIRLTSANTETVADLLVSRALDIALVEGPIAVPEIVAVPWRTDELAFILAANHPLAETQMPIPIQALTSEVFVLREPGSGTREVASDALSKAGFAPVQILEVSDNEALTRIVAAGIGIGIVSSVVAADQISLGRIRSICIRGVTIKRTLSRLHLANRQLPPAALAFEALLTGR